MLSDLAVLGKVCLSVLFCFIGSCLCFYRYKPVYMAKSKKLRHLLASATSVRQLKISFICHITVKADLYHLSFEFAGLAISNTICNTVDNQTSQR